MRAFEISEAEVVTRMRLLLFMDVDEVEIWLRTSHLSLGGAVPMDLFGTEREWEIEDLIDRLGGAE